MALYELGKAHFAINSDGTFRYLGRLIKKYWYNISSKQWTFKYQFSKNDGITTDTVVVNYIPGTFKELEPKVIYTAEEKVAYEKEKRGTKDMAKFKVGDKVKVIDSPKLLLSQKKQIGKVLDVVSINEKDDKAIGYYLSDCADKNHCPLYFDNELELVEPKEDKVFDFRRYSVERNKDLLHGLSGTTIIVTPEQFDLIGKKFSDTDISFEQECRQRGLKVEVRPHLTPKLESVKIGTIKKAFERPMISEELMKRLRDIKPPKFMTITSNPSEPMWFKGFGSGKDTPNENDFPYYHLSLDDDALDAYKYAFQFGYSGRIQGVRPQSQPPKNRIPDRVVFNQDKGKVTVLISKHLDGVAPYWAYTSKVHGDDEYNGYFGFMLSYYKYLNRHLGGDTRKELIDMAFQHGDKVEYIIEGAVSQEVLKIVKIDEWDNILTALLETSKQGNGYWDYAEWKEMLRVHELETKREEQKAIRKEIKKHEQEIEKLKKKGV